jgi:hypothetical protein
MWVSGGRVGEIPLMPWVAPVSNVLKVHRVSIIYKQVIHRIINLSAHLSEVPPQVGEIFNCS